MCSECRVLSGVGAAGGTFSRATGGAGSPTAGAGGWGVRGEEVGAGVVVYRRGKREEWGRGGCDELTTLRQRVSWRV